MTIVKICGIKTLKDALAAIEAGADYLGFNFYPKSVRFIEKSVCAEITSVLKREHPQIKLVGVFVNSPGEEIKDILQTCHLSLAQLHGDETPETFAQLVPHAFRAFRGIPDSNAGYERSEAPAMLIDAAVKGVYGGSGVTADWAAAAELAKKYPLLLAGGLTPENVVNAVRQVQPWGVDVASGVESASGEKDAEKMSAFVKAVKQTMVHRLSSNEGELMSTTLLPHKFGPYGGQFVPETLMPALIELEREFVSARNDPAFNQEFDKLMASFVGRPTPLTYAKRLSEKLGGAQIYLKREDLAHTGAHKINNALGQALLVKRMGKKRIVAETGAGQHGVASATAAALLGLECVVYMGSVDIARQEPNVFRMKLLGAEVRPVESGTKTLKDAINEAIRDWVTNVRDTHYLLGSALGPHPYPTIVREFQSVIGREAREQMLMDAGRLPDTVIACVGGGSNAIGVFSGFVKDEHVEFIGVEAGGSGIASGKHAARFGDATKARVGVIHGTRTYVLQDEDGQIAETHSVSAGLDYAAVGPEHAMLRDNERAFYTSATDEEALNAFQTLCHTEGIIPALESSHAVAEVIKRAPTMRKDQVILVNLSGRGDKDLNTVIKELGSIA